MVSLVTSYGTFDVPSYWDGTNGLDFRLVATVDGTSVIRLYAPAYALLLETRDVAANVAGAGFSLSYSFDTGTSAADPGSGNLRLNNATAGSATAIYVSDLDSGASDRSGILALFDDSDSTVKGQISVNKATDKTAWLTADLTATTDGSGFYTLTLSNVQASSGTPFASGDLVVLGFTRTGDKGETGAAGGGLASVADDTTPQLGGDLDADGHDITGVGALTVTGTATFEGLTSTTSAGEYAEEPGFTNATGSVTISATDKTVLRRTLTGDVTLLVAGAETPGYGWSTELRTVQDGTGGRDVTILPANLYTYPNEIDNAAWAKTRATTSTGAGTAPDGQETAVKLVEDGTAANNHQLARTLSKSGSALTYTFQGTFERDGRNIGINFDDGAGNGVTGYYDLATGSVASYTTFGSGWTATSAQIAASANAGYDITVKFTTNSSTSLRTLIQLANDAYSNVFNGDSTSGVIISWLNLVEGSTALGRQVVGATRAGMVTWRTAADEIDYAAQAAAAESRIIIGVGADGEILIDDVSLEA